MNKFHTPKTSSTNIGVEGFGQALHKFKESQYQDEKKK